MSCHLEQKQCLAGGGSLYLHWRNASKLKSIFREVVKRFNHPGLSEPKLQCVCYFKGGLIQSITWELVKKCRISGDLHACWCLRSTALRYLRFSKRRRNNTAVPQQPMPRDLSFSLSKFGFSGYEAGTVL